jgi:hypothetical protein
MPNCNNHPVWNNDEYEFRIKPQPKEPQYLYVYFNQKSQDHKQSYFVSYNKPSAVESCGYIYLGKIKLEVDD